MSTVLRAQRHEFANRLHLLNGLLHSGHVEEAAQYVEELLGSGPLGSAIPGIDAIRDAFLQAFLAAKSASARESGVTLTIGENTWVPGRLALPVDVTTVLGNLLDNAIYAAAPAPTRRRRWKSNYCRMIRHCTSRSATEGTEWHPSSSSTCSPRASRQSQTPGYPEGVVSEWRCHDRSLAH